MPTETEVQDAVQQDQKTSTGPETHQTQAQPQSGQQRPLNTPPQTTPSTGTTGAASSTLGAGAQGSGSASQTLPGGSNATTGGTSSPSSGMTPRRSMSPASLLGDPLGMVRSFMDQMDRIFDDFTGLGGLGRSRRPDLPSARSASGLGQGSQGQSMGFWYPQVEVSEKGGNLVVCADLPGLKKEDVRLEIHDDYLVLEGERRNEREENQEGWYRTERSYGRFYRTIPLPEGTNPDQIRANFKDGVLEVTVPMPNREEQQRGRRIEIQ